MNESRKRLTEKSNTVEYLLANKKGQLPDSHQVKVAILGSGYTGVAVAVSLLFKRIASELVLIDANESLARAEAQDISHAGAFLGNPSIYGTKDYSEARDAAVCVIAAGAKQQPEQTREDMLRKNLDIFKTLVPNVCKFAPNSVLVIVSSPVDILSYVAMKLSGFPPNRVIGIGTFLDSCRFRYLISQKLGIAPSSVQAMIIGENGTTSVPVWSAVSVMGMKLKDINKEIGTKFDPEGWNELHNKVVSSTDDLIRKKGYCSWGIGLCVGEIVDAIIRNTCVCLTVSTFLKGCKHGLEKDIYMSLPCIIGRNGVQSLIRYQYTEEEQELTTKSCKSIYELQKTILDKLE
ncbi:L-lactate dehydrogenase A-like 6A [Microplitis demolitor]|uniref:L-lactate dehydrogenase A-like 6A n=1 Tax=Microplitis demolitor TaxID=69319 RepID=UPI0004CDD3F7|nr:L-lactate dehydrogenase A-like 6A [Microplitis demolitor]